MRAAQTIAEEGAFSGFDDTVPVAQINNLFHGNR